MARLPSAYRILREDLGPNLPPWIDRLIVPLNIFMQAVYSALDRNLNIDNLQEQMRDITFTTSETYTSGDFTALTFPRTIPVRATSVVIAQINIQVDNYVPITDAVNLCWRDLNGIIRIEFVAGLANSTTYNLRVTVR